MENGKFIFAEDDGVKHFLTDNLLVTTSDYSAISFRPFQIGGKNFFLLAEISKAVREINDESPMAMFRIITFLSVINELTQKPKIYKFLQIGTPSKFTSHLAYILKVFDVRSQLYCLTDNKTEEEFQHVSFMSMNINDLNLPNSKFDAVFFDNVNIGSLENIPREIYLSLKNFGKIFFIAHPNSIPQPFVKVSKEFKVTQNYSLMSFTLRANLKANIFAQSDNENLNRKKNQIVRSIKELSKIIYKLEFMADDERKNTLDGIISSIAQSEKIFNEIYAELNSRYTKTYFNELKEALIDYRLTDDENFKSVFYDKILERYKFVLHEMTARDDFAVEF